ncbi:PAS domain S-box protein [Kineosporia sp. NBRC 101731]|uniref:PAS domain S-box protein n=1 Tax=Kineosporia sp. NBRC 101731 TaxID=3032199 RepID=UPI0024A42942|nr:PAS domain S-box protein [Kineosporia sp. NBRC 101731]GLY29351.1 hypothetical protein Kisp02_27160 [Kineosporia sp. NBRC 101731]
MELLAAVLAFIVAAMYAIIAFGVLPQLARAEQMEPGLLRVARWGAMAFFAGCALTHLGMGIHWLHGVGPGADLAPMTGMPGMASASTGEMVLQDVLPHVAQVVGGGLLIAIAWSRLEWSVLSKDVARELREHEVQYRSAFERAPVGIVLVGVTDGVPGQILQVNPALCALVNRTEDQLRGSMYQDLYAPADMGMLNSSLTRLIAEGALADQERQVVRPGGQPVWVSVGASLVRDDSGSPLFAVAVVRDITGQRRAEELRNAQQAVARVVSEEGSAGTGMVAILQVICQSLGWAGGEYWESDVGGDLIARVASWPSPGVMSPSTGDAEPAFTRGQGLPGAVWSSGSPIWLGDLARAPGPFARAPLALQAGIHAVLGIPLRSGDRPGVLVFFASQMDEPDADTSTALEAISAHIGRWAERARAEEFRRFVESAPDATVIADQDGQIVLINAQTERLFGYPRNELLGEKVEKLVPEQFRAAHPGHRAEYFLDPTARSMASGLDLYGLRKDGTQFPVEISLSPLETDGGLWVSSSIRDLTERRQAEEARFRLAAIVDSSDDAMLSSTLDGTITSWNPAAQEIFGYTADQVLGSSMSILIPADHASEAEEMLARIRRGERVEHHDAVRRCADGHEIDVSISLSAIHDQHGTLIGAAKVVRDITARKQTEVALAEAKDAAETSSKAFEAFSYSVAHDLRAPLRAIDGFSQALTDEYTPILDEIGLDYLQRVRTSAQQMAALIDGLLSLAKVTHSEISTTTVDLSALATTVLARLQEESPLRRVDVLVEPGLTTLGDRTLLANALENLLTNAWKFTRDAPQARIEFGRDGAGYFVRDNGAGFDMAFSAKLFGVFQRLHSPQEFQGTGIGLATVQRIIQRHGGHIQANSSVGHGATFHFTLAEKP